MDTVPTDVADVIRRVNASNEAVEDQCLRARQAADLASRSAGAADQAATTAVRAEVAHQTIQAERPRRCAPLPRQVVLALITVALDGLACYFAAQALDGSQDATLVWTALFLSVLAGGEFALDFYKDRSERTWHSLVILIGTFVTLLGTLRFWFLVTIGGGGLVPAIVGAFLFTGATAGFLSIGYRALRVAETTHAWRARRQARKARQTARAARTTADRDTAERDRLIDAYLGQVRRQVLKTCPVDQQLETEEAVREHLSGRRTLNEGTPRPDTRPARDGPRPLADERLRLPGHLQPPADDAQTLPAICRDFDASNRYQPGFPSSDAGYGSARNGLSPTGRTASHSQHSGRSGPGLLASPTLPQHADNWSAGGASDLPDKLPESPPRSGCRAVPEDGSP
jgi:hypothetical protein